MTSAIYDELKNITIIIISQKIQTIKNCDRIVVMDKGMINGIGSHDELMGKNDIYMKIAETQNEFVQ